MTHNPREVAEGGRRSDFLAMLLRTNESLLELSGLPLDTEPIPLAL